MTAPNRRRLRFTLRTLFVVVTAAAVTLAIVMPAITSWLEYRRLHKYDELFRLIMTTAKPTFGPWTDESELEEQESTLTPSSEEK